MCVRVCVRAQKQQVCASEKEAERSGFDAGWDLLKRCEYLLFIYPDLLILTSNPCRVFYSNNCG